MTAALEHKAQIAGAKRAYSKEGSPIPSRGCGCATIRFLATRASKSFFWSVGRMFRIAG